MPSARERFLFPRFWLMRLVSASWNPAGGFVEKPPSLFDTPSAPTTVVPMPAHMEFTITFPNAKMNFSRKTGMLMVASGSRNVFLNEQQRALILKGFFREMRFSTAIDVRDACATIVATGRRSIAVSAVTIPDFISRIASAFSTVFATMTRMLHHIIVFVLPRDFSVARYIVLTNWKRIAVIAIMK